MGADAVELDVFVLKCGTIVVFHGSGSDANPGLLEGYCINLEGSILQYTNEEIQNNLVFNEHFEEFGCHPSKIRSGKIPTLEEVLMDAKTSNIVVKIELKGDGTAKPVLELVEQLEMQHQCHFSSFNLAQIAVIRQLRPHLHEDGTHVYKTGALFKNVSHDFIELAKQVGASEVHLRYDECTKDRVGEIHAAGMDSMAWFRGPVGMRSDTLSRYLDVGNEDAEMYKVVMCTGVRQMCVNRPDVLVDMF
jgi:glycerophosphoryl diester phosphodiesterase